MKDNKEHKAQTIFQSQLSSESIERFKKYGTNPAACGAQSGDLRCSLDAIHIELGSNHVHRAENGTLTSFRDAT